VAAYFDPSEPAPGERDERLHGSAARIEIRPASRVAHLGVRSLACPSCGVPLAIATPVGLREEIACAFCEGTAPARAFMREAGWPEVDVIARMG
jgi:hypothetical protein